MRSFDRLFRPKSIAVIGGGTWCSNLFKESEKIGFTGKLWSIHPTKTTIAGYQSFPSINDLPEIPDVAFVAVNRRMSVKIVAELAKAGCGGVVCFASGFLEAKNELNDGANLQQELLKAAGEMPLLGPNCYGYINALDGVALWPDQHGLARVDSGVAIIAQSSNIAINLTMQTRGLPIAYMITVGNQAQTSISEIVNELLSDSRVTAIGLYIEGIDDLENFQQLALLAKEVKKHIVVVRVGKSNEAKLATITHTASIAGTEAGSNALMHRLGFAKVDSLPAFLETLKLFHVFGSGIGNQLVSMSCSGGEAGLIADSVHERKLEFPSLTKDQRNQLRKVLGPEVTLTNPLDYHTQIWSNIDAITQTFVIMMNGDCDIGLVILDFPRQDRCVDTEWKKVIEAVEMAKNISGKKMAILSTLPENMPESVAVEIIKRGIVPLAGIDESLLAIEAVARVSASQQIQKIFVPKPIKNLKNLSEFESKIELKNYDVKIPKGYLIDSIDEVAKLGRKISYPVALKAHNISHKTEMDAVVLNISQQSELFDAINRIKSEKFLIEEMICNVVAELLIGIVCDPAHGYVLTIAPGGIYSELYQDSISLMVPSNIKEVKDALSSLKFAKVLKGYRGNPSCDLTSILNTIMAIQNYVILNPVIEIEINPLLCGKNFAVAGDALIQLGEYDDSKSN